MQFYDVLIAKEFETKQGDKLEKRTRWNRVGTAWPTNSGESLHLELFMLPGHKYFIQLQPKQEKKDE